MSNNEWDFQLSGTCIYVLYICIYVFASKQIGPKENNGTIETFTLVLHGTRKMPEYRKNGPRIYNQDYNRMQNIVSIIEFIGLSMNCIRAVCSSLIFFTFYIKNVRVHLSQNEDQSSTFKKKLGLLMQETNDIYEKEWLEFL